MRKLDPFFKSLNLPSQFFDNKCFSVFHTLLVCNSGAVSLNSTKLFDAGVTATLSRSSAGIYLLDFSAGIFKFDSDDVLLTHHTRTNTDGIKIITAKFNNASQIQIDCYDNTFTHSDLCVNSVDQIPILVLRYLT